MSDSSLVSVLNVQTHVMFAQIWMFQPILSCVRSHRCFLAVSPQVLQRSLDLKCVTGSFHRPHSSGFLGNEVLSEVKYPAAAGGRRSASIPDETHPCQPKAFPLRAAWAPSQFRLRTGRSRLKMVSWSLSSSDSDIIRLELCSVLRCLMPAERKRSVSATNRQQESVLDKRLTGSNSRSDQNKDLMLRSANRRTF